MKILISENQLRCLSENKTNPFYVLFHSTDSEIFDVYDHSKATKGDRYFNPLGNGLYCSTNKEFSKGFGKNQYYYLLPKTSKIKVITQKSWSTNDYSSILNKVLKKYKINWYDLDFMKKIELHRLGNDSPISSLNNLSVVLSEVWGLPDINKTIEDVVDQRNSKYDAIWYRTTDFYLEADEVVIPPSKFKKEYLVKEISKK